MGFNKRYVRKETIINMVKEHGVKSLDRIFTPKVDAYIFEDQFSSMIFDLFVDEQYRKIECLIR
jgi:hypothetical protein